jgi:hypothetical protein
MANDEHVALLKQGVDAWNAWREENLNIRPDLSGADLHGARLSGAILMDADLTEANLGEAYLRQAKLVHANLSGANLSGAYLGRADLRWANLSGADLQAAALLSTDFTGANLTGCRVYGITAWNLTTQGAEQRNLVITRQRNSDIITQEDEFEITVDDIEVAQFVYLLLHNEKIRDVIDTVTSKAVLILGRFTDERKAVSQLRRAAGIACLVISRFGPHVGPAILRQTFVRRGQPHGSSKK